MQTQESNLRVNVAPTSDEGHFITEAVDVVNLDTTTQTFLVKGKSRLETKNHTTLTNERNCLITCQVEYNPFTQMMELSKD